jgi:hypothetical protein
MKGPPLRLPSAQCSAAQSRVERVERAERMSPEQPRGEHLDRLHVADHVTGVGHLLDATLGPMGDRFVKRFLADEPPEHRTMAASLATPTAARREVFCSTRSGTTAELSQNLMAPLRAPGGEPRRRRRPRQVFEQAIAARAFPSPAE